MQTCMPHLFCLITVTVCLLFDLLYMRFGSKTLSQSVQNFMAIEFILIPPIVNPLIYGLKLTQIRKRILQFTMLNVTRKISSSVGRRNNV